MAYLPSSDSLSSEGYFTVERNEKLIRTLESGVVAIVISPKKRTESLTLKVLLETKELISLRTDGARPETIINLHHVKDLRLGKKSSDFDKCLDETHKLDSRLCIVIVYGSEFNLKTYSIYARDKKCHSILYNALQQLIRMISKSVYLDLKERWLHKQFHLSLDANAYASVCSGRMENACVGLKDIRRWLMRNNCKINSRDLKGYIQRAGLVSQKHLSFYEYRLLFIELLHPKLIVDTFFRDYFKLPSEGTKYRKIGFEQFREFLSIDQKTDLNPEETRQVMISFLEDPGRSISGIHFTEVEFVDYLFSDENEIFKSDEIEDDMNQPLSSYWIASSHNTYLTGNQLSSESSVEPYARCLRMGCRCVELDCWNGPDGIPVIYHGKTLTTKIKFADVLQVIRENAFYSSNLPVILSLENHCLLPQQKLMAKMLKEILGEALLTAPITNDNKQLPSPNQLLNKIIIKDKKLKEEFGDWDSEIEMKGDVKCNGVLLLKDETIQDWREYFCVLNERELILSTPQEEEEEEEDIYDFPLDDIYSGEEDDIKAQVWYHGMITNGSKGAEKLFEVLSGDKEGAFLVRDNDRNGYSLSFWHKYKCSHCRLKEKDGKFCLNKAMWMDSVFEVIEYYRVNPLYLNESEFVILKRPVPITITDYQNESWYHNINRCHAENLLKRAVENGTFLIRPSSISESLSLSLIYNRTIRHFTIQQEGRLYVLGSYSFLSLKKLVNFFTKKPVAKNMKLRVPASVNFLSEYSPDDSVSIYDTGIYSQSNCTLERVKVKALYDFKGGANQLSFRRGAIITNVLENDSPWWSGNIGDQRNKLFPANYVEVLDNTETDEKSFEKCLTLEGCKLELCPVPDQRFTFKMYFSCDSSPYLFACSNQKDYGSWLQTIKDGISSASANQELRLKQEVEQGRAQELSDLIIYCQSVRFQEEGYGVRIAEMSSFSESIIAKYLNKEKISIICRFNLKQISRVYPSGIRVFSANYDPIPMWSAGCQMVALNYQTPDKHQQINDAFFLKNNRCGYVLKPSCMNKRNFSPFDVNSLHNVLPVTLSITVLAGRYPFSGKEATGSHLYVAVEIIGLPLDKQRVRTTTTPKGNILSPIWQDEVFVFDVTFPELAFIRFEILDESSEKSKVVFAQATFPLRGIREGFRSVPLKNVYSERNDMASLLVHVEVTNPLAKEEKQIFNMIEKLRDQCASLSSEAQKSIEMKLLEYLDERQIKRRARSSFRAS